MAKPLQADALDVRWLKLDDLKLDPTNVRRHSDRNIEVITGLLRRFKQQTPIVVDGELTVRKGNGTVLAARKLREAGEWGETIACVVTNLKGEELKAYAIGDNRASELSDFDQEQLAIQLHEFSDADLVKVTGFDDGDLQEMDALFGEGATPTTKAKRALTAYNSTPSVRILVTCESVEKFERAMMATGEFNREAALMKLCESFLKANPQ